MKDNFDQEFSTPYGQKIFQFASVFFGAEKTYRITPVIKEIDAITFRMKRDENQQWFIQAQALPEWLLAMELELGDAIDDSDSTT